MIRVVIGGQTCAVASYLKGVLLWEAEEQGEAALGETRVALTPRASDRHRSVKWTRLDWRRRRMFKRKKKR